MASHTSSSDALLLRSRADRIAREIDRARADGWLLYDFRGSNPALGRLLGEGLPQSTRRAFLYIPARGEPRLLIHHVDAGNFARLGLDVQSYGGREEMLARLRALLGPAKRVLMEYSPGNAIPYVSRVDAGTLELVRALGVEVLSSADALAVVIAAWDDADLASHERAAAGLDRAKDELFAALRQRFAANEPDWDEVQAQQLLVRCFERDGLEFDHAPIVAVNAHAGDPHYAPEPGLALPIRRGDLLLIDLWVREIHRPDGGLGAYADITWMATAAENPPAEQVRVWETVRDARDAAVHFLEERAAAGQSVQGGEVDRTTRAVIEQAGYGEAFTHRTGHSIGWHGAHGDGVNIDDFETNDVRFLLPGASFSIEPGIYLPTFGVRSEIDAVITPEGAFRVTTPIQRDLVRLV
jgi:Xaa-Pro aminopeptidase